MEYGGYFVLFVVLFVLTIFRPGNAKLTMGQATPLKTDQRPGHGLKGAHLLLWWSVVMSTALCPKPDFAKLSTGSLHGCVRWKMSRVSLVRQELVWVPTSAFSQRPH